MKESNRQFACKNWSALGRMALLLRVMSAFVLTVLTALSLASFFDKLDFVCQMLSHVRLVLAFFAILLSVALLALRLRWFAAWAGAIFIIDSLCLLPMYVPAHYDFPCTDARFSLLQMNLWGGRNREYEKVITEVERNNPDVVCFSEITDGWLHLLTKRLPSYRYVVAEPRYGGIALLSKLPVSNSKIILFGEIKRPRVEATFSVRDTKVFLIVVHTVTPLHRSGLQLRTEELTEIAADARNSASPVVVAGDINCSPWSSYFADFVATSKLRDSEQGFGVQPTWNAWFPLTFIPIDHFFISPDMVVFQRRTGKRTGSDHLPVFIELGIKNESSK
jgi:endonuclease/exonuclease/phosphatase (EEP) superfamily protein YafD